MNKLGLELFNWLCDISGILTIGDSFQEKLINKINLVNNFYIFKYDLPRRKNQSSFILIWEMSLI